mgnify:CR=1 FL=1
MNLQKLGNGGRKATSLTNSLSLVVLGLVCLYCATSASRCEPSAASNVAVSGDYAYVTGYGVLQVIDVSTPSAPARSASPA